MATIRRTYMVTNKGNLNNIDLKNGQVIAIYDSDEVYYDISASGSTGNDDVVRRRISGVRVVTSLPTPENVESYDSTITYAEGDYCVYDSASYICISNIDTPEAFDATHWVSTNPDLTPNGDIVYVYIGEHGTFPGTDKDIYDVRVWVNGGWYVVGTNIDDINVKTSVSDDKFYLVGTSDMTDGSVGTLLKNSNIWFEVDNGQYIIHADAYEGTVAEAEHANTANSADTANTATRDAKGNTITNYIIGVSATSVPGGGTKLSFTTGDPASYPGVEFTVPDTTYDVFTPTSAGLVPIPVATTASPLDDQILFGDGTWKDKDDITIGTAAMAVSDTDGDPFLHNYIKELSYDTDTDKLTITYGDYSTDISIPNTEYRVYPGPDASAPIAGLVPAASSSQLGYFLKGNGTWQEISVTNYDVFDADTDGLVPHPGTVLGKYLRDDHTWAVPQDTKNTVGSTNSNSRLFIVGAGTQDSNVQSYTNTNAFIDNGILYSQGLQVVNLGQSANDFDVTAAYAVDDTCKYLGVYYRCIQAITATSADAYSEVDDYDPNDLCVYESVIYRCDTAISYSGATSYETTSSYTIGDLVSYDNKTYSCIADTPNPAGGFDDEFWDRISEFDPSKWTAIKAFNSSDWAVIAPQNLYNKRYENYTLGNACEGTITDVVDVSDNLPTSAAVSTAIGNATSNLNAAIDAKADSDSIASNYDTSSGYSVGDYCYYNDDLYRCKSAQPQGDFDPTKWDAVVLTDIVKTITVKVPEPPTTNGTYYLKAVVSGGAVTYSWSTIS